jgi:hypothetical protein
MIKQLDDLQIYFGEPLVINERFQIAQPTLRDVIKQGEAEYYGMVHAFTAWPCDYISFLHDNGMNYMEVSDIEFFSLLTKSIPVEKSRTLFGNLDFSKFELMKRTADGEIVLYNREQDVLIDEVAYAEMHSFLSKCHLLKKKRRKAGNKSTYKIQVEVDRQDKAAANLKKHESQLQPMVSAMVNFAGFKYSIAEVRNMTIYQFMDSVQRVGLMISTERLAHGYYSGNIDPKKIDIKKQLDWMRCLHE